jgi:hypothetical protein
MTTRVQFSRRNRRLLSLLSAGLLGVAAQLVMTLPAAAANTTYYVSATGSDGNSGTSQASPWRNLSKVNTTVLGPGDQVLFRAGDSWTGQLTPNGSGNSSAPITYGAYGSGTRPVINGAGVLPATVHITSQQYLNITGLEITNNTAQSAIRSGILVDNPNTTPLTHIHLTNLSIHNVAGQSYVGQGGWSDPGDGGIVITGRADSASSRVDDLLIDGATIDTVDDAGIRIQPRNQSARATGVVVRNVSVNNAGGNGILVGNTTSALVEHNKVTNSGSRSTACAGIWPVYSDGTILQYNEVSGQNTQSNDGYAFDLDWRNTSSVFQYNYSHDNPRGFLQIFQESSAVVRYNISQNDATWDNGSSTATFGFYAVPISVDIYNNTIYRPAGATTKIVRALVNASDYHATFRNNIIVNSTSGTYDAVGTWNSNVFFGNHPASEPADPAKITADPLLAAPGTATSISDASGYALKTGSPALGSGALISNNGGRDFFGNAVSSSSPPHRGAYNGPGVGLRVGQVRSVLNSNKCLDVDGANASNGTKVQLWDCWSGSNQQWIFSADGTVRSLGKCLDIYNGSGNGALLEIWDCNGGWNQQWQQQPDGSIRNPGSGRCLDLPGANTNNGTQLNIWDCWGGANQRWTLP